MRRIRLQVNCKSSRVTGTALATHQNSAHILMGVSLQPKHGTEPRDPSFRSNKPATAPKAKPHPLEAFRKNGVRMCAVLPFPGKLPHRSALIAVRVCVHVCLLCASQCCPRTRNSSIPPIERRTAFLLSTSQFRTNAKTPKEANPIRSIASRAASVCIGFRSSNGLCVCVCSFGATIISCIT